MNITEISKKIKSLPTSPGVYIFKNNDGAVIYVGKATSLKDRVGSYFQNRNGYARPIEIMIHEVVDFEVEKTETVLEAYILEQELIKKLLPQYNVDGKDDKSFAYVVVTKEDFPRFIILRKTEFIQISNYKLQITNKAQIPNDQNLKNKKILNTKYQIRATKIYGPYTSKKSIEIALKILRKIFPYHTKPQKSEKGCLDSQIGLCPGPYDGSITKEDYRKNIRGIRMILEGKKKRLIATMKKEMDEAAGKNEFEKAAQIRNKIFALQHIQDIALISQERNGKFQISTYGLQLNSKCETPKSKFFRIEGYDISNISGKFAVGSMIVFDNCHGEMEPNKSQYRRFKIRTIEGANDVGSMEEVLIRRFRNNWTRPNLILLDGGAGHLNAARRVLRLFRLDIPILSVAKGPERKKLDLRSFGSVPELAPHLIELIRDEAHRFAITYHRKVRLKNSLI